MVPIWGLLLLGTNSCVDNLVFGVYDMMEVMLLCVIADAFEIQNVYERHLV